MRIAPLTAPLLVAAGLALGAAGCGDDKGKEIPRDEARNIVRRLQEADRRVSQDPPVCGDLSEDSIPALEDQVANLPEDVDEDIKQTLEDGVQHLRSLIEAECTAREQQTDTDTTTTDETTTEEEPPDSGPQEGQPDTTTQPPDTTTQPTDTTTPPDTGTDPNGGQSVPEGTLQPKVKKPKKGRGG